MEQIVPQIRRSLQRQYGHMMIRWYEAVDWKEPLIVGAIAFHTLLFTAVFFARKRLAFQCGLFALILLLLVVTEPLNTWARANWRLIATQNYFDPRGVFMGIFYAGPLLAAGFFQLLLSMKSMVQMLIVVKRAELQQQLQQQKKQTNHQQQQASKPKHE